MATTTEEIVYEQSVRAITQQERSLDELRSRTAIILAAFGLTASFLGRSAIDDGTGLAGVVAILVFAVGAFLAILVLLPQRDAWWFTIRAKTLLEDWVDEPTRNDPAKLHRFLAEIIEVHYGRNAQNLSRLFLFFWVACIALAVDIGAWLVELAVD